MRQQRFDTLKLRHFLFILYLEVSRALTSQGILHRVLLLPRRYRTRYLQSFVLHLHFYCLRILLSHDAVIVFLGAVGLQFLQIAD